MVSMQATAEFPVLERPECLLSFLLRPARGSGNLDADFPVVRLLVGFTARTA
jgi:hypothetical protein